MPHFLPDEQLKEPRVGIATGMAWTEDGGRLLQVETLKLKSQKGGLKDPTGNLKKIMKESVEAALSYVRSYCEKLNMGVDSDWFTKNEIHVHVPQGAIPKDGPSAGVTLATALLSLVTERPVNNNLAMTGEINLQGQVLPVGGIKEKTLAAFNRGLNRVLLPKQNEKDLSAIPENIRNKMDIVLVKHLNEVFEQALLPSSDNLDDTLPESAPAAVA